MQGAWVVTNNAMRGAYVAHFGIKGMNWGIRRFQNEDGSLTPAGRERYGVGERLRSAFGRRSGAMTDRDMQRSRRSDARSAFGSQNFIARGVRGRGDGTMGMLSRLKTKIDARLAYGPISSVKESGAYKAGMSAVSKMGGFMSKAFGGIAYAAGTAARTAAQKVTRAGQHFTNQFMVNHTDWSGADDIYRKSYMKNRNSGNWDLHLDW